jgi:hypothetical protein
MVTSSEDTAASAGPPRRVYALTTAGDELRFPGWTNCGPPTDCCTLSRAYDEHEAEHMAVEHLTQETPDTHSMEDER